MCRCKRRSKKFKYYILSARAVCLLYLYITEGAQTETPVLPNEFVNVLEISRLTGAATTVNDAVSNFLKFLQTVPKG